MSNFSDWFHDIMADLIKNKPLDNTPQDKYYKFLKRKVRTRNIMLISFIVAIIIIIYIPYSTGETPNIWALIITTLLSPFVSAIISKLIDNIIDN